MRHPFLTARWTNLAVITYPVPPGVLLPYLPPGLELETRAGDAFVSLVAFDFEDTRVWGGPWPGYRNFSEFNLRFYARAGQDRGVVFIREFLSKRMVAWIANAFYNEHFFVAPVERRFRDKADAITAELDLHYGDRTHQIAVTGRKPAVYPAAGTDDHFFTELHWGFGTDRHGQTVRFAVEHPPWKVWPVESFHVDLDWGQLYGPHWAFQSSARPVAVSLSPGSEIRVFPKEGLPRRVATAQEFGFDERHVARAGKQDALAPPRPRARVGLTFTR